MGIRLTKYNGNDEEVIIQKQANLSVNEETPFVNRQDGWKDVTHISAGAFANINELVTLVIPNTVTHIEEGAIVNCPNARIFCNAPSKPEGWHENFHDGNNVVVLFGVPEEKSTFTFNTNGGSYVTTIENYALTLDDVSSLRFGYDYDGLEKNQDKIVDFFVPQQSGEYNFDLLWKPWEYEVRYYDEEMELYTTQYVKFGETLGDFFNQLTPPESEYGFLNWLFNGSPVEASFSPTQNKYQDGLIIDIVAQFDKIFYVTFKNDNGSTISIIPKFTRSGVELQYSFDTVTWVAATNNVLIENTENNEIYMRGKAGSFKTLFSTVSVGNKWGLPNTTHVTGNLNYLLCNEFGDSQAPTSLWGNAFAGMFRDCTSLIEAPTLPATVLNNSSYQEMFAGCTSLIEAPELPTTTLVTSSYREMFAGCTSLIEAPALPATTLGMRVYQEMFKGCTSLIEAPELPATTLNSYCYQEMFAGCTSLIEAPELPTTTLDSYCYQEMFMGCTSLIEAPELPATTIDTFSYRGMFKDCISLIEPPTLPATTVVWSSYREMFMGCTSLIEAPELPATTIGNNCYQEMFKGCTSLEEAHELPATAVGSSSYLEMFKGCTSLIKAPEFSAISIGSSGCREMFYGCTSLIEAPALPATTLGLSCYKEMFMVCTSLIEPPSLPATQLNRDCYEEMFRGCTSLERVTKLPAITLDNNCYRRMFIQSSIKVSETQNATYQYEWRIPETGEGTDATAALSFMISSTGGPFTQNPSINTTYYTDKEPV